ncbi:hypothetical protein [Streptomyces sp. NPDC059272]|uniref:hypothetical protein n=1 Tax=Streptomyces sp. NPDC059272 TaxID=3346800 RepID=UPI0036859E7C
MAGLVEEDAAVNDVLLQAAVRGVLADNRDAGRVRTEPHRRQLVDVLRERCLLSAHRVIVHVDDTGTNPDGATPDGTTRKLDCRTVLNLL